MRHTRATHAQALRRGGHQEPSRETRTLENSGPTLRGHHGARAAVQGAQRSSCPTSFHSVMRDPTIPIDRRSVYWSLSAHRQQAGPLILQDTMERLHLPGQHVHWPVDFPADRGLNARPKADSWPSLTEPGCWRALGRRHLTQRDAVLNRERSANPSLTPVSRRFGWMPSGFVGPAHRSGESVTRPEATEVEPRWTPRGCPRERELRM